MLGRTFKEGMVTFARTLFVVVVAFNMLSGVAAAIALAYFGLWGAIVSGAAIMILGPAMLTFALWPAARFVAVAIRVRRAGRRSLAACIAVLGPLYTNVLLTAWCLGILYLVLRIGHPRSPIDSIPALVWGYNAATGPIAFRAWKEAHETGEYGGVAMALCVQAATIVVVIASWFTSTPEGAAYLFITAMITLACVQMIGALRDAALAP
jgi:hypothetical protein